MEAEGLYFFGELLYGDLLVEAVVVKQWRKVVVGCSG